MIRLVKLIRVSPGPPIEKMFFYWIREQSVSANMKKLMHSSTVFDIYIPLKWLLRMNSWKTLSHTTAIEL